MKLRRSRYYILNFLTALMRSIFCKKNGLKYQFNTVMSRYLNTSVIAFHLNGRSALFTVMDYLVNSFQLSTILIPNRICNVVEDAARKAGFSIKYYNSSDELRKLISHARTPLLVLQASTHITDVYFRSEDVDSNFYLFDECQRFASQSFNDFVNLKSNEFLVYSFNDKTIPGQMGGISLSNDKEYEPKVVSSLRMELQFWAYTLKDFYTYLSRMPFALRKCGEYSTCLSARYRIGYNDITNLSLFFGLYWLRRLKKIEASRIDQWKKYKEGSVTSYCGLKPYTELDSSKLNFKILKLLIKGPYLKRENEEVEEALDDFGCFALVNSIKYKYS